MALLLLQTTILEVTSGNTGIGLATVAIRKGYKVNPPSFQKHSKRSRSTASHQLVTIADRYSGFEVKPIANLQFSKSCAS